MKRVLIERRAYGHSQLKYYSELLNKIEFI